MKKLTYKYVKEYIESVNKYKLLSLEYINSRTKLKIQCPKDHIFLMRWGKFQNGRRCPECNKLNIKDLKKKTLIIQEGYVLLSTKYINAHSKLKFKCNRGHIFKMTWNGFQQGHKCLKCYNESQKLKYNNIKKYIESVEGYKLLSKRYIGCRSELKVQCSKGHIYKVTWHNFKSNSNRCVTCYHNSLRKNYTKEELLEIENYKSNVVSISNKNYYKYYYKINPNKFKRGFKKYHLDHIYSIMDGFKNNIQPEVMSNPNNLQMLWCKKNVIKSDMSWQTK